MNDRRNQARKKGKKGGSNEGNKKEVMTEIIKKGRNARKAGRKE